MLVLSRSDNEEVMIGPDVRVMLVGIQGGKARLGFKAPNDVVIHRAEIGEMLLRYDPNIMGRPMSPNARAAKEKESPDKDSWVIEQWIACRTAFLMQQGVTWESARQEASSSVHKEIARWTRRS